MNVFSSCGCCNCKFNIGKNGVVFFVLNHHCKHYEPMPKCKASATLGENKPKIRLVMVVLGWITQNYFRNSFS